MENVDAYVDGSFNKKTKISSWAFIIVKNGNVIYKDRGVLEGEINDMWQVGGEMNAIIEAIIYCRTNKYKANIYYDFINLYKWVADLFGKKPWKTNNVYTKDYRDFVFENKESVNKMVKVKSHSGVRFNEEVDKLAKFD